MSTGRVSFTRDDAGRRVIDSAEVERVYRDWSRPVATSVAHEVARGSAPVAGLESEVERLRAEVAELKVERRELLARLERQEVAAAGERARWLGIIERYTQRLLPAPVSNFLGALVPSWLRG